MSFEYSKRYPTSRLPPVGPSGWMRSVSLPVEYRQAHPSPEQQVVVKYDAPARRRHSASHAHCIDANNNLWNPKVAALWGVTLDADTAPPTAQLAFTPPPSPNLNPAYPPGLGLTPMCPRSATIRTNDFPDIMINLPSAANSPSAGSSSPAPSNANANLNLNLLRVRIPDTKHVSTSPHSGSAGSASPASAGFWSGGETPGLGLTPSRACYTTPLESEEPHSKSNKLMAMPTSSLELSGLSFASPDPDDQFVAERASMFPNSWVCILAGAEGPHVLLGHAGPRYIWYHVARDEVAFTMGCNPLAERQIKVRDLAGLAVWAKIEVLKEIVGSARSGKWEPFGLNLGMKAQNVGLGLIF